MLLDDFLSTFDFNEVHTIQVNALSSRVFFALKSLTPSESAVKFREDN
jgi:hypothetical protein